MLTYSVAEAPVADIKSRNHRDVVNQSLINELIPRPPDCRKPNVSIVQAARYMCDVDVV